MALPFFEDALKSMKDNILFRMCTKPSKPIKFQEFRKCQMYGKSYILTIKLEEVSE